MRTRFPQAVRYLGLFLVGSLVASPPAMAEGAGDPGSREALAFFEGAWTTDESPPEAEFVETCGWLDGGRSFVACTSTNADGPRDGMSVFGYREEDGLYVYYGFRGGGSVEYLEGRSTDDGWVFGNETGAGASRVRTRVTITKLAEDGFRLVAESAQADGPWVTEFTAHYRRVAPREHGG